MAAARDCSLAMLIAGQASNGQSRREFSASRGARLANDSSQRESLSTCMGQGMQMTGELSKGTFSLRVRAHTMHPITIRPYHYDILDAALVTLNSGDKFFCSCGSHFGNY